MPNRDQTYTNQSIGASTILPPSPLVAGFLVSVAEHLVPDDGALIRAVYLDGKTIPEVARLRRTDPRTLRRRITRLVLHCHSSLFAFAAVHIGRMPPELVGVARLCLLQGRSAREAARLLQITIHTVRMRRLQIIAMHDGVRQQQALLNGESLRTDAAAKRARNVSEHRARAALLASRRRTSLQMRA